MHLGSEQVRKGVVTIRQFIRSGAWFSTPANSAMPGGLFRVRFDYRAISQVVGAVFPNFAIEIRPALSAHCITNCKGA